MNSTSDTVEIVIIFFRLFSCIQCASSRPSVTCVAINTDTISMPNSDKNIRRLKSSPDTSATTGMELFNGASGMADFFNTLFWLPQALFPLLPSTPSQPNLYSAPQYPGLRYPTTNNTHLHFASSTRCWCASASRSSLHLASSKFALSQSSSRSYFLFNPANAWLSKLSEAWSCQLKLSF